VGQELGAATPFAEAPRYLIRDNDVKYGRHFDPVAIGTGIEVPRTPIKALWANAICERLLGSVRRECLDHILISVNSIFAACSRSTSPTSTMRGCIKASTSSFQSLRTSDIVWPDLVGQSSRFRFWATSIMRTEGQPEGIAARANEAGSRYRPS